MNELIQIKLGEKNEERNKSEEKVVGMKDKHKEKITPAHTKDTYIK